MVQQNIRPLGDKILVRRAEADNISKGGIVIPESAKEKTNKGTILAIGSGRMLDSGERQQPEAKVNDNIIFSSYAGVEIKVDGENFLLIREDDILAIIT